MNVLHERAAIAAAVASIGALGIPAAAGAAVSPPVVVNNTLTVTTTGADADTIALSVIGGKLAVNGAATTLAAGNTARIVVDAGAGNDTIDATALGAGDYSTLFAGGGEGDDAVTGGAGTDLIDGDEGDDRITGFKGVDNVFGDEGDDVMVWNNGDNTDRNDGGPGVDNGEVNGAPTVADFFKIRAGTDGPPEQDGPTAQITRVAPGPFNIKFAAERLTVNGLGGDDIISRDPEFPTGLAAVTSLKVDGGDGSDTIVGGD